MSERDEAQRKRDEERRRRDEERREREQQERQQRRQEQLGIAPSPPPYEAPETPLERLGAGFGYLIAWVGGAFLLNLAVLALIAANAGG